MKLPDNLLRVLVEEKKAELLGLEQETPYLRAETVLVNEEEEELPQAMLEAMYRSIRSCSKLIALRVERLEKNCLPRS